MTEHQQWSEHRAPDNRPYWYNATTRRSMWEKPDELKTPEEKLCSLTPWKEYIAPNGKKFWHNPGTKASTWFMPQEYRDILDKVNGVASKAIGGTDINTISDSLSAGGDGPIEFHFNTKEEAEECFMEMLKDAGVNSTWTWEKCMRVLHKLPKYRALKSAQERQEAFDKYLQQSRRLEAQQMRFLSEKRRADFRKMLEECEAINYMSPFEKAQKLFSQNTAWIVMSDDKERRELFDDYTAEMRRKARDEERDLRNRGMQKFEALLKQLPEISEDSRWTEIIDVLQKRPEFEKDEDLRQLHLLDQLMAFETHIKELERKFAEERRVTKHERTQKESANRIAFRELLAELSNKNLIQVHTKWKEIYPLIKDDPRYTNMLGQTGSSPLDLFRDVIVALEDEIYRDGKIIQEIMRSQDFEITLDTTLDQFQQQIGKDSRIEGIKQTSVPVIFEVLQEKAQRRIRRQKREEERRLRHLWDDFKYLLKKLDPAVSPESTWEQVQPRIKERSAYLACDSDEMRQEYFLKYLKRLAEKKRRHQETEDERSPSRSRSRHRHHRYRSESRSRRKRSHRDRSESSHRSEDESRHKRAKEEVPPAEPEREEGEASSSDEGEIKE